MKLTEKINNLLEAGPEVGDTVNFKVDKKLNKGKLIKKIPKNKLVILLSDGEEVTIDKDLLLLDLPKDGIKIK